MASEITNDTLPLNTIRPSLQSGWLDNLKYYRLKLNTARPYLSPYRWTSQRFEDEMLRQVHSKVINGEHEGSLTIEDIRAIQGSVTGRALAKDLAKQPLD